MNRRMASLAAAALVLTACTTKGGAGGASGGGVCASGKVDLTKISGDWIASGSIKQPDGTFGADQYRIHFASPPGPDGKLKGNLAFRLDSRPYTGTFTRNSLGGQIEMLEDMTDETIASLRANADPNVPMRSVVRLSPQDDPPACLLFVSDETITYAGQKDYRHPTTLGSLKLVPAPAGPVYSFVRCDAQRAVYFDGKADEGGMPVRVNAGKSVTARVTREKKGLPECPFDADYFVDGKQVAAKVAAAGGKEDNVDAMIWSSPVTIPAGPRHSVEVHMYSNCASEPRKLLAGACNFIDTP